MILFMIILILTLPNDFDFAGSNAYTVVLPQWVDSYLMEREGLCTINMSVI